MAYNYSNPFASAQPSRSTFAASIGSTSTASTVLFSGLPLDVSEKDLRELLMANPLNLPASTTRVQLCHNAEGRSLGTAVVTVGNEVDAERMRREYSGQVIDAEFRLQVQHLLPATAILPSLQPQAQQQPQQVAPFLAPTGPAIAASRPKPQAAKVVPPKANGAGPSGAKGGNKPEGLKLLARMGPGGGKPLTPRERQLALMAQQKSSLKSAPGQALLARLARQPKPSTPASRPNPVRNVSGADKVARAKKTANGSGGKMQVDKPVTAAAASAPKRAKTQAELDEEMRVYERQRRFAAAA